MSDYNNDSYRYDNNSRRTVRAESRTEDRQEHSRGSNERRRRYEDSEGPSILYDARGVRVKQSKVSNEFINTLLFFVLPYIVINTIVFLLVTSTPKIEIKVSGTDDYKTATANFTVSSLLPLKEVYVTMESEDLPYTKSGSTYTAIITKNGTFYVEATSINGMRATGYSDISILDDTPPTIDDSSCHIEEGILSFKVSDTQSGINWSKVYATTPDGRKITGECNEKTGEVRIPMDVDAMELHVFDLVGNERTASVTATEEQLTVSGPVTE